MGRTATFRLGRLTGRTVILRFLRPTGRTPRLCTERLIGDASTRHVRMAQTVTEATRTVEKCIT
jgi:hypothetical protein